MKFRLIFLAVVFSIVQFTVFAQIETENDRSMREQRTRETAAQIAHNRRASELLRRGVVYGDPSATLTREKNGVYIKYKPNLTEADLAAISVHPADTRVFAAFLKQPDTGIVRLQNGDVCMSNRLVIQADSACPNNVIGKATLYSFRENDYRPKALADIFFSENKFSSPGVFTLGVFANLGDVPIENLTLASNGVKQLIEFQPAQDKIEVEKQYATLTTGIQVGDQIYKREVNAKENSSFVLRTIAYKGKVFQGTGDGKINILANDARNDVTVVFRIVRKHDDGSITLLWKELERKPSPKIVLEEKKDKRNPEQQTKNDFAVGN
jgi:hypothetical protein